jgi:cysteine synthase A
MTAAPDAAPRAAGNARGNAACWRDWAVGVLRDDRRASPVTPLLRFPLPAEWGIDLYLKDESVHPTGSLKHRLARSLLMQGLVDGAITEGTTLVEASSGSTAVSEAYFARELGLPFVAVMPASTSARKIDLIESYGARCVFVDRAADMVPTARERAHSLDGYFVDQFSFASTVSDWMGETGIAAEILAQLEGVRHPVPDWFVVGVGTGGSSSSLSRYCRSRQIASRVAIVDPQGSAYFDTWCQGDGPAAYTGSRIEGIGRPTAELSFIPDLVDQAMRVPDALSIACLHLLHSTAGIFAGGSTGTNLAGAFRLIADMRAAGRTGSIVTLVCDAGERYTDSYYDRSWLDSRDIRPDDYLSELQSFLATGLWPTLENGVVCAEHRGAVVPALGISSQH